MAQVSVHGRSFNPCRTGSRFAPCPWRSYLDLRRAYTDLYDHLTPGMKNKERIQELRSVFQNTSPPLPLGTRQSRSGSLSISREVKRALVLSYRVAKEVLEDVRRVDQELAVSETVYARAETPGNPDALANAVARVYLRHVSISHFWELLLAAVVAAMQVKSNRDDHKDEVLQDLFELIRNELDENFEVAGSLMQTAWLHITRFVAGFFEKTSPSSPVARRRAIARMALAKLAFQVQSLQNMAYSILPDTPYLLPSLASYAIAVTNMAFKGVCNVEVLVYGGLWPCETGSSFAYAAIEPAIYSDRFKGLYTLRPAPQLELGADAFDVPGASGPTSTTATSATRAKLAGYARDLWLLLDDVDERGIMDVWVSVFGRIRSAKQFVEPTGARLCRALRMAGLDAVAAKVSARLSGVMPLPLCPHRGIEEMLERFLRWEQALSSSGGGGSTATVEDMLLGALGDSSDSSITSWGNVLEDVNIYMCLCTSLRRMALPALCDPYAALLAPTRRMVAAFCRPASGDVSSGDAPAGEPASGEAPDNTLFAEDHVKHVVATQLKECPVCLEEFESLTSLTSSSVTYLLCNTRSVMGPFHALCTPCATSITSSATGLIMCPLCRVVTSGLTSASQFAEHLPR